MTDREAKARELIDRCEAAWHQGNAAEPGAMVLADILADVIRLMVPEADDRDRKLVHTDGADLETDTSGAPGFPYIGEPAEQLIPESCTKQVPGWEQGSICELNEGHAPPCLPVIF